jgi:septal ring factor EnvC (AmiA/AmiB activator)
MMLFIGCSVGLVGDGDLWAQAKKTAQKTATSKSTAKTSSANTKKNTAQKPVAKQTASNKKKEDINALKNKQDKLKKQMQNTDKKLTETRRNTMQSLRELERLNEDIVYRDQIIKKQADELNRYSEQIDSLNVSIDKLSVEYDKMKKKQSDMIYYAFMTKNTQSDFIIYILSSKNFQEAYRRVIYLSNLATIRKEQSAELNKTKQDIQLRRDKVDRLKNTTKSLMAKQEKEKEFALYQKQKQDKLLVSLKAQEKLLKSELEKQQIASERLNQKIQNVIAQQAAAAKKRKKTQTTTKDGYAMTREETTVAGGFEKNQGRLPWPVKGTITGSFGKQPHPVLKDVTVNNKGVYITAAPGSKATSVYDGTVSQCFSVPGNNNAVIVRHGNYLTVYANLTDIYVKSGAKIAKGAPIGKIYEDSDDKNKATLFFQVWKEKSLLNPQQWLKK